MASLREILLAKIGEEAGEVAQAVGKNQSYSLEDKVPMGYKDEGKRNIDFLRNEIIDLIGNWEIFADKCKLDGIDGLSLLSETGMLATGPQFYEKHYNGIDPVVLQKIRDRKQKVFKSLDICIRTGTLAFEEVYGRGVVSQLKRGDFVFFKRGTVMLGEPLTITEVRYYDPTLLRDDSYPLDVFIDPNTKFAVLRDEPSDRLPHHYFSPNEVGMTLDWLAANKDRLHYVSPSKAGEMLGIARNFEEQTPFAALSWFRSLM